LGKISRMFESKFAKNVIMIAGGTAFSQILSIAFSPLITRIYSPNDYGILTVYVAILGVISLLGALSYESAIPIAVDDKEAINLLSLCIVILLASTAIIVLILLIFGNFILAALDSKILSRYKYFIPLGFFVTGIYTIFTSWAFRKKDFKAIAKTKLSQSISGNVTKVVLGLFSTGPIGLLLGTILGQSAGITTLAKPIVKLDNNIIRSIDKKIMVRNLKRYINFPLFSAPTILLSSLITQIPVIYISSIYGTEAVGLYGLAYSITFLPMTFIGKSVQDVFYGEAASVGRENPQRIKELSTKLFKKLVLIGLIPMTVLILLGPNLFSLIFGIEWHDAGMYSRVLTFYAFSYLIFHPISVVYSIFERQRGFFILNIIKLIFVLVVFGISKLFVLDSYTTILVFSIAMVFIEFFKYFFAQKIMDSEVKNCKVL